MTSFSFDRDNSLYKNRDALLEEYTPNNLVGRDDELEEYHAALQPIINGEAPSNIFLYGKSGVGKTAATRFLLNQLQEDAARYDDISLSVVEINCDGLNSSYQVAVRLVNTLRDPADQISNTGYPQAQVYSFLWDELDLLNGTIIIVLDEVDHINDNSILYQIPRARSNGYLEHAKIGLIGISNDLSFRDSLSAKVRSSLCEKEVSFPPYDATELQKVLRQRDQVAFHESALAEDVIPLCAAYGAQDAGDARQALDLLLEAGDLARKDAEGSSRGPSRPRSATKTRTRQNHGGGRRPHTTRSPHSVRTHIPRSGGQLSRSVTGYPTTVRTALQPHRNGSTHQQTDARPSRRPGDARRHLFDGEKRRDVRWEIS